MQRISEDRDSTIFTAIQSNCESLFMRLSLSDQEITDAGSSIRQASAIIPQLTGTLTIELDGEDSVAFQKNTSSPLPRIREVLKVANAKLQDVVLAAYATTLAGTLSTEAWGGHPDAEKQKAIARAFTSYYECQMDAMSSFASKIVDDLLQEQCRRSAPDYEETLQAAFRVNQTPTTLEKKALARHLNVPFKKVHNWFQNQRTRKIHPRRKPITATLTDRTTSIPLTTTQLLSSSSTTTTSSSSTPIAITSVFTPTITTNNVTPLHEVRAPNNEMIKPGMKRGSTASKAERLFGDASHSGTMGGERETARDRDRDRVIRKLPRKKGKSEEQGEGDGVPGVQGMVSQGTMSGLLDVNALMTDEVGTSSPGVELRPLPRFPQSHYPSPTPSLSRSVSDSTTSTTSSSSTTFTSAPQSFDSFYTVDPMSGMMELPPNQQFGFTIPPPSFELGVGIENWDSEAYIQELLKSCLEGERNGLGQSKMGGNWWDATQITAEPQVMMEMEDLLRDSTEIFESPSLVENQPPPRPIVVGNPCESPVTLVDNAIAPLAIRSVHHQSHLELDATLTEDIDLSWLSFDSLLGSPPKPALVDDLRQVSDSIPLLNINSPLSPKLANEQMDMDNHSFIRQWYPDLLITPPSSNLVSPSNPRISGRNDSSTDDSSWNSLPFAGISNFDGMEWDIMEKGGMEW